MLNADGGNTAQYTYDAMNQRVRLQTASSTHEYLYDYAGRRISSWNASTNGGDEGRIYWDGQQIAYRAADGTTYFEHQTYLPTERMRTDYTGAVAATFQSLPWGDGYSANVAKTYADQDNLHFAALEQDLNGANAPMTDHAQFRQYSFYEGRWMSPDPYMGSYNFANPQTLNRYVYAGNNPLSYIDPDGTSDCSDQVCNVPGGCPNSNTCWTVTPTPPPDCGTLGACDGGPTNPGNPGNPGAPGGNYPGSSGQAPSNGTPKNPCSEAGGAPDPSYYTNRAKQTLFNPAKLANDLSQFPRGRPLDAQPLGGSRAYGNYVYGAYLRAADVPLFVALSGADAYAFFSRAQYGDLPRTTLFPFIPADNVANITAGYNAAGSGTLCHK